MGRTLDQAPAIARKVAGYKKHSWTGRSATFGVGLGMIIQHQVCLMSCFPVRWSPRRLAVRQPNGCAVRRPVRVGSMTGEECRAALRARATAVRGDRAVARR